MKLAQVRLLDVFIPHKAGPYLDDARNHLVYDFLQYGKGERLLILDSDIEFEPAHVQRLVDDDLPIVSGLYHNIFGAVLAPVVFNKTDPEDWRTLHHIEAWTSDDPIVQCDTVGAGFLMIRKDVIETFRAAYPKPCQWFHEPAIGEGHMGEDVGFCIRAAEQGIPVMVDRRVELNHYKTVCLPQRKAQAGAGVGE